MDLKKFVIGLILIAVTLTGVVYASTVGKFNIYSDGEHVLYNQVLDDVEIPTVYYYYQDTCHFCNSIKDQITNLYLTVENNDKINMKLVDAKSSKNADVWAADNLYNPNIEGIKDASDIKITGTPAMIYVKDGKVDLYETGAGVFEVMESVNQEFKLGLSFDQSKYGK